MNKIFVDYYKTLGINIDATKEEIRKAFYKKALEVHPDRHATENLSESEIRELEEQFNEVRKAYSVLSSPKQRKRYDEEYKKYYANYEERQQEKSKRQQEWEEELHYRKTQAEKNNRRKTYQQSEKENSFVGKIKKSYQEVKNDEKKASFKKRHSRINDYFYENFSNNTVGSVPKEICFRIGQGVCHVVGETFYQISKLKYIVDDSIPKFIIRNRNLIATAAVGAVIMTNANAASKNTNAKATNENPNTTISTSQEDYKETEVESNVVLNRRHKVEYGDTFYELAWDANMSAEELEKINDYDNRALLLEGDVLDIPYTIEARDLQYYTQVVPVADNSIYTLAKEYETDQETILALNQESIQEMDGAYLILSDTVVVPKFITQKEFKEIKRSNNSQYQKANQ